MNNVQITTSHSVFLEELFCGANVSKLFMIDSQFPRLWETSSKAERIFIQKNCDSCLDSLECFYNRKTLTNAVELNLQKLIHVLYRILSI
jgi:hypothetical protein